MLKIFKNLTVSDNFRQHNLALFPWNATEKDANDLKSTSVHIVTWCHHAGMTPLSEPLLTNELVALWHYYGVMNGYIDKPVGFH